MTAQATLLPDGRRLHLHHGPMDLIAEAWGDAIAVQAAYARAAARFAGLLDELVAELPALRSGDGLPLRGAVAQAMGQAVAAYRPAFITPMAAVAGAVADEILSHIVGPGIAKAYVNNGGDIALYLTPGEMLTAAVSVAVAARTGLLDRVTIRADDPVRGIATSGWRGRSFSLGIADAVTVLARSAARADAAATMLTNAVDLPGHPAVARCPADQIKADSDLGARLVTVAVGVLPAPDITAALDHGLAAGYGFQSRGLIEGAALFLQGQVRTLTRDPSCRPPFHMHPHRQIDPIGGKMTATPQTPEPCHG